jgi:hypothetical protein
VPYFIFAAAKQRTTTVTKINPYDMPLEEERNIRIVLKNIEWSTDLQERVISLPRTMSVPVASNLPEEEMISKAIDGASSAWGYCINDCDIEPIDYGSPKLDDSLSDTLEYEGKVY